MSNHPSVSQALVIGVVVMSAAPAGQDTQTFTGIVTDSTCANADHSQMRMGPTDAECASACVFAHGDAYVLFDGVEVYNLSAQPVAEELAGRRVKVTGTLDAEGRTIQVDTMAPVE